MPPSRLVDEVVHGRDRSTALPVRSAPIVDDGLVLMPVPHSEPATWPGKTCTSSGNSSSRRRLWKRPSAPSRASTARSGRATEPTKSESPVSSASPARKQQCSGRCPGVCKTADPDRADLDLVAVGERAVRVLGVRRRVHRHRQRVLECETAVAGDVVGVRVCLEHANDSDSEPLGLHQVRLDRVRGIDEQRLAGRLVADEVGGAPEVLVDELPQEHPAGRYQGRAAAFLEVTPAVAGTGLARR